MDLRLKSAKEQSNPVRNREHRKHLGNGEQNNRNHKRNDKLDFNALYTQRNRRNHDRERKQNRQRRKNLAARSAEKANCPKILPTKERLQRQTQNR